MKPLNNRLFVALFSFLIGAATVWTIDCYVAQKTLAKQQSPKSLVGQDKVLENLWKDDFFNPSSDPFAEMRKMREQMFKDFWDRPQFRSSHFGGELNQREDDQFVYYEIDLKGKKPEKLEVEVKDGQVSITGKIEEKSEQDGNQSIFSSSFHSSFPAPSNVIEEQFKMEQEGNKIIIKFPKS